jgi:anti-sigma B factor antagonist
MEVAGKADGPAAHKIVLDCTKVSFLASAGIGMMIAMRKHCMDGGGQLVVCGLGKDIMDALRLTRVDKLLQIESDRSAALAKLS